MKAPMPESIEGRWDILYRDFAEVYDEFARVPRTPPLNLAVKFGLQDKIIADIGSGTGDSSFDYARSAKEVIGVEIEESMLAVAERRARAEGIANVRFIPGDAARIPLDDDYVDAVTAATLAIPDPEGFRDFAAEAERITRDGGIIIVLNIAPGWYGGELHDIIDDKDDWDVRVDKILEECGFEFEDFFQDQEYGSLDKIVRTYGFIFGSRVIRYLRESNKTSIRWKLRIRYKRVDKL